MNSDQITGTQSLSFFRLCAVNSGFQRRKPWDARWAPPSTEGQELGRKDGASQWLNSGVSSLKGGPSFSHRDPTVLLGAQQEELSRINILCPKEFCVKKRTELEIKVRAKNRTSYSEYKSKLHYQIHFFNAGITWVPSWACRYTVNFYFQVHIPLSVTVFTYIPHHTGWMVP